MIKSYANIYHWIISHMGKDGLCTTTKRLAKETGYSLSTVYNAIKCFKDNRLFDVEYSGGHILFLKDLSKCENYSMDDYTYYLCSVRYINDVKYYEPENPITEPLLSISFGPEPEGVI